MAKVMISMRIEEELLERINAIAEKEGVTRTDVMEFALANGVENEQEFVEALEKPMERLLMKLVTSRPLVDAISVLVGKEANKRRVKLSQEGLKGHRKEREAAKSLRLPGAASAGR